MHEFLLRREWFGSVAYRRSTHLFYSFDDDATAIFLLAHAGRGAEIFQRPWPFSRDDLDEFVAEMQGLGLLGEDLRLDADLAPDHAAEGRLSAPLRIYWGVTYRCNASCVHCLASAGARRPGELTLDELRRAADEMADLGVCEVTLGGGEPLMRRDILPFIEHLRHRGIEVELTTNAFLVTRALAKKLAGLDLRHVDVSFDGGTEATFDAIRGAGSFRKASRGLRILCDEMACGVEMHVTGMKPNIGELDRLATLAASAGCRGIGLLKVRPLGRLQEHPELLISPSEFIQAVRRLEELCDARGILAPSDLHLEALPGHDLFTSFGCVGGNTTCWIDGEGNVAPCSYYQYLDSSFVGGNLRTRTLKEIWASSPPFRRVRHLRGNSKCLGCEYLTTCRAGCRALGRIYGGSLSAPDPYCVVAPDDGAFRRYVARL